MPVINSLRLHKYKQYYVENIKGKNGVTKPITKVKYVKQCCICGGEMELIYKKGGVHKREIIKWTCNDKICNHSEMEESKEEYLQRIHNL